MAGRGCVIRNAAGQPLRFIGINHDVTEHIERERVLDGAAKNAASASEQKSRFVAQVSHEIRTPLAAMLGCIDSLVPSLPQSETRDTLRVVRSQGEMLRILVNDVLDLSKIEAGPLELEPNRVRTHNIFADICSLTTPLAVEKGLSLKWEPVTKLPRFIECDVYRLKQVMINLIGNAIKFTREGGISIITEIKPAESPSVFGDPRRGRGAQMLEPTLETSRTQNLELVIKVTDTGVGIDRDKLPLIFDEYEHAGEQHSTGTGLGLAICERLVGLTSMNQGPSRAASFRCECWLRKIRGRFNLCLKKSLVKWLIVWSLLTTGGLYPLSGQTDGCSAVENFVVRNRRE